MPTPIEEGWFWYTPSDGPKRPQPMQVVRDAQGHLHIGAPTCGSPHPDRAAGTWGERIPDSPTLEAMREMATLWPATSVDVRLTMGRGGPIAQAEQSVQTSLGRGACHFCGRQVYGGHIDHTLDCPWLRAQEGTT